MFFKIRTFYFNIYLFIYLAVLVLSCITQDLCLLRVGSSLWHAGSSSLTRD